MFSQRTGWKLDPNRFTLAHQALLREGREVLDLTISNPTRIGIQYDAAAILNALRDARALDYDPQPKGLRSARKAIAQYYSCGSDSRVRAMDPESIMLTTSTSEGYSHIFRLLCNPSDEVLVPKPSYPLFDFLADLEDVNLAGYPLIYDQGWQIDFESLEKSVTEKTRAIVVVHPNNPTGSYVSAEEHTRLNDFSSRHRLALIADEVFLDYALRDNTKFSFAYNDKTLTFTLSGLSKISALPQMKLAWIVVSGPKNESDAALQRLEVIADTYLSLNAPVQLAARALLEQRRNIQPQLMTRVPANLAELDRQISSQKACTRLDVQGGWCAILRIPVTRSDEDMVIDLLQQCSVLVHPGHFYDFPCDGYLVLSLITPEAQFREGMSRVLRYLN